MSAERYSTLDEPSLRNLLLDIRTVITNLDLDYNFYLSAALDVLLTRP